MTQSGQGEEPSSRPAREGIVLPSDGGEPLLPGLTSTPSGTVPAQPSAQPPASAPPGGQTWGQPWGPERPHQQPPTAPPGQDWQQPQPQSQPSAQWGAQPPASWSASVPHQPSAGQQGGPGPHQQHPGQPGPGPLPPEGAQPQAPAAHSSSYDHSGTPAAPLPHQGPGPLPPVSPEGATQYLPPVPGGPAPDGADGATQYIPPVSGGGIDEGATQYIPPVGPGALPPERPAGQDSEETRSLRRPPQASPQVPAGNPDAEATQYIPPVTGQPASPPYGAPPGDGNRQPPAEFDNLFRNDSAGGPVGSTQQLPRIEEPQPPRPARAARTPSGGGRGRPGSRVPLLAVVGVVIAAVGIGAGALLAGDGTDDGDGDENQTVSATAPASEQESASPSPSADPVREQAVALDKLLADSGDSRSTVIKSVADVKACRNLPQAAKNLRAAAKQRTQLVTDLSRLSVDKLPRHTELTTALTKAWQASASADNHYALWADQVAGAKGKMCKKGQARATGQTQAGNRDSGTATAEKGKAAPLWNAIARQYGLTERQPTQL